MAERAGFVKVVTWLEDNLRNAWMIGTLIAVPLFMSLSLEIPAVTRVATIPISGTNSLPFHALNSDEPVAPGAIRFLSNGTLLVHDYGGYRVHLFSARFVKIGSYLTLSNHVAFGDEWIVTYRMNPVNLEFWVQTIDTGVLIASGVGGTAMADFYVVPPYLFARPLSVSPTIWKVDAATQKTTMYGTDSIGDIPPNPSGSIFEFRLVRPGFSDWFYGEKILDKYAGVYRALGMKGPTATLESGEVQALDGSLFGQTSDGLRYFYGENSKITILDRDANVLRYFSVAPEPTSEVCTDTEGSIYFFHSTVNGHELYKITRSW